VLRAGDQPPSRPPLHPLPPRQQQLPKVECRFLTGIHIAQCPGAALALPPHESQRLKCEIISGGEENSVGDGVFRRSWKRMTAKTPRRQGRKIRQELNSGLELHLKKAFPLGVFS
jgi:hypothetical protein